MPTELARAGELLLAPASELSELSSLVSLPLELELDPPLEEEPPDDEPDSPTRRGIDGSIIEKSVFTDSLGCSYRREIGL